MRILHICPAPRLGSPLAPESLQYLGHRLERMSLEQLHSTDAGSLTADVVVADACLDLSVAPTIAEAVVQKGLSAPIVVVLSEGGLATASARWNVSDIVLTTAGPAEVEARLRLARDRHTSFGRHTSSDRHTSVTAAPNRPTAPGAAWPGSAAGATWPGSRADDRSAAVSAGPAGAAADASPWEADVPPWEGGGRTGEDEPMVVISGGLRIDETAFTAHLGRRSLDLTYREFALLKFFAMHPERVFTRDEILLSVWGEDYYGGTRTVDVHVRRVRAKLGKDLENAIHTVRNVGYRFSPDSPVGDAADAEGTEEAEGTQEPETTETPHDTSEAESNEEDVKV
ncbi:hypothetical protein GCM10009813_25650 [Brevibacterium marinum]|uniref:DNA-binding response OmpR family regulator n=1 Tax=Brevibacterium marinum TaxID=418643 RepID=A0A846RZP8_9MICO|nr:winged helix-turn-helix domain-containing protein [Brevibacterium marinum]NJC56143.1 DNA-binding response OmpR family regulator [Brevibacterium marinum]